MSTVTFTELRNHARKYFDQVERGETFEIYRHGKPVAILLPPGDSSKEGWKRVSPMKIFGVSLSQAILADRQKSL
ncbi:MAG: type II toxin-antitoxin system Phd/YefM family antitoxin [Chlamydiae bacterium]|nr:type II toxin-antitoxin system Phd/YefM family antitoxin [Chlamydiota bacterium]MBI3276714.1 type II toxin-antitoxin system Phd/YefM family antitoxin [Chlamydiota bacterium]